MGWYDQWFVDWGATDWTKDEDLAHTRYSEHILDMQKKKSWPGPMVTYLIQQSQIVADESPDGASYWATVSAQEPSWIVEANVNPGDLQKIQSHIAFLQSAGGASDAWNEALETYSPHAIAGEVVKQTGQDLKDAANPFKSWIPWAVGAVLIGVVVLKR